MDNTVLSTPTASTLEGGNRAKDAANKKLQRSDTMISVDVLLEMEDRERENFDVLNAKKSNKLQSYMNSVKIFLGNVYLTIPHVFSHTGWLGGIMLYTLVAVLNTFTMTQILQVAQSYSIRKDPVTGKTSEVKSYTDLAERVHGKNGKLAVIIFMFIVQFSCCVGYLYYVAGVLDEIICDQTNHATCGKQTLYKFLMLFITIPLSLLKTYTYLSYVSMSGIACAVLGGLFMMGYFGNKLATDDYVHEPMKVFDVAQFFGYIGIAMFSFEGNGIVINLKAEAKDKQSYPGLLRLAIATIIVWYMTLATISYATYRSETGLVDYITQNIPITGFTIAIMILFCMNALTSYPVQILCAFEIIEDLEFFKNKADSERIKSIKLYTERVLVIIVVTIAAILIPRFVDFLNISGSLGAAALGFILPPMYDITSKGGLKNVEGKMVVFNIFLISFGIFGGIYSLYNSIWNLVNEK